MKKRPKAVVKEYKGIYELWFGKYVLLGSTSRERLEQLARLMNP